MSPLPALPTGSGSLKAADLTPLITAIEARLTSLEAYVNRNDQRIAALEGKQASDAHGLAEHQAGTVRRKQEINQLRRMVDTLRRQQRRSRK